MPEAAAARPSVVRSFVRRFRTEILAEWKQAARELAEARTMSAVTLVDHIPELLDEIADIAEELAADRQPAGAFETARRHALDRLADGFDVTTVVRELSLLRAAALAVWARENTGGNVAELRALDLAIDHAIAVSVGRYTEAHERTLAGIDRISTASFESNGLPELLERLLTVFNDTTPAVDTAAILLVEGGRLAMRAQVGVPVVIDNDLATTVVRRREPVAVRLGGRTLYGVPLVHNDRLIGVAFMGSVTAHEFSQEDRQFFTSMAARATVGIVLASVTAERERTLAKLESLLEAAPAGIAFVDVDLRYLRINDALAAMNGRPAAEHIGRTVEDMLPDVADRLVPALRRVIETGEAIVNCEIVHDGRSMLASYFPVRLASGEVVGVGGVVTDVTDLKHAQEALRTEQARIQAIIEHAPAAIWVKDREGKLVLANRRLAEALGHPFEDVIGQRSTQLLPPDIAAEHEDHDRKVLAEQRAIEFEEVVPAGDGTRTFLSIKFPIPGQLVGGIATEITHRKRMERELRMAVRTREDVLAVVSHDLRNPLGTVQLSAGMLMDRLGTTDPRARRHLEMIQRSCGRMENLIDDLLDTANIRAGRLTLDIQRVPAESIVGEAIDLQQPAIEEQGIRLVRDCRVDGVVLMCDANRILQVFGNLIGNAIKFCRAGDTITVACETRGNEVAFSVADTGPGIQPDILPYLFDPYWSAPRKTNKGAGLGLYIARGIVEGHGGRIGVESAPGAGATFRFTLPRAPSG